MADANARDVRDGVERPGPATPDDDAEVACTHPRMLAAAARSTGRRRPAALRGEVAVSSAGDPKARPRDTTATTDVNATLRLRRLPDRVAAARPIDVAEAFRDLPGLALLESARPGRNARWTYLTADPIAVLESPAAGPDPFAVARSLVGRLDPTPVVAADAPRFLGGLVGFLGYDLGGTLERLPAIAAPDQDLPPLRLALHDWVVAWDRRTGSAWLGGRALDGDGHRLARRLDEVHARLTSSASPSADADRIGTELPPHARLSVRPGPGAVRGRRASPFASTSRAATSTRPT